MKFEEILLKFFKIFKNENSLHTIGEKQKMTSDNLRQQMSPIGPRWNSCSEKHFLLQTSDANERVQVPGAQQ